MYLKSPQDAANIQEMTDIESVHQVIITKARDVISSTRTNATAVTPQSVSIPPSGIPGLAIQQSQYPYTAGSSPVTFTHAKKNALAAGLISSSTPVYAVFFSVYFDGQFDDIYVPVYETRGNSGDFKVEHLPTARTGAVNVVLTTADGKTTFKSAENVISTIGLIEVLPSGQRNPYPSSLKSWDIHHMTGVDKLHNKGIRGQGVKIGLVSWSIFIRTVPSNIT